MIQKCSVAFSSCSLEDSAVYLIYSGCKRNQRILDMQARRQLMRPKFLYFLMTENELNSTRIHAFSEQREHEKRKVSSTTFASET